MSKIADIYPLSPTQQGLLFHSLLTPGAGLYVPQIVLTLEGPLDPLRLRHAWESALKRHEVLRTSFHWEQRDEPFQVVRDEMALPWTELDWSGSPATEHDAKLQALQEANRGEGFDLQRPPLIRLHLVRLSKGSHKLVWCYHHLLMDGWSAGQVMQEVLTSYLGKGTVAISAPRTRYADYLAWLKKQDANEGRKYWEKALSSASKSNSPHEQWQELGEETLVLSKADQTALQSWTRENQITLHTVLLGLIGILLGRRHDEREIILGHTVAGRPEELPEATKMVGLFINTLPVPMTLAPDQSLKKWLRELQNQQATARAYEHLSLREIQSWTNDGQALFDWLFVLESYPLSPGDHSAPGELTLAGIDFDEWTHFPLTLLAAEGENLILKAKFQKPTFSHEAITRIFAQFTRLLRHVLADSEVPLSQLTLTSAEDITTMRAWNETSTSWPNEVTTIRDLIQKQEDSQREAIRFQEHSLTHAELHKKADALAAHLQSLGAGPECPVAIYLERSLELPVSILAILKTGAVYFPLDPSYPKSRLEKLLQEGKPTALIIDSHQDLPSLTTEILTVDWQNFPTKKSLAFTEIRPEQAAYLIFTSGSTGKPKGVLNTHRAILNRLLWKQETYQLEPTDRVLQKTPVGFDVSVWEFYWPMMIGATLVEAEPELHRDSHALVDLIQQKNITVLHFVPPMLDALLEVPEVINSTCLRLIICSGETLTPATVKRCHELLPNAALHNLYGPTEAAIDVTAWECSDSPQVPIGNPIANTAIHLLDRDLNEVPIGEEGELFIGGDGLARGYLGRPDLTAQHFIPNPFRRDDTASEILYRSGDRARYRTDGAIEFIGRNDDQIKIRGQRIELAEIESALLKHPSIQRALVIQERNEGELVAYLVTDESTEGLADFLRQELTEAMIPHHWITLSEFPLSTNGKIDRKALPQVSAGEQADQYLPLGGETQHAIAEIWKEVLKVETLGANSHFFRLGGHSLSATRANTRLRKRFELEIPLRTLFDHPVLADLAQHLDNLLALENESTGSAQHLEIEL